MKSILTTILFILLLKITCAQLKPGISAGINIANIKPIYVLMYNGVFSKINGESVINFNVGIHNDFKINKAFSARFQLLYSGQGAKGPELRDQQGNIVVEHRELKLSYINLPLQFFYSPDFSFGKLFIGLGPYGGILLGGKVNLNNTSRKINVGNSSSDDLKRFDFGLYNSAGIRFKNGLAIGANYGLGLINISTNDGRVKNYVLSFSIGYY
jgi:hypothetical protein